MTRAARDAAKVLAEEDRRCSHEWIYEHGQLPLNMQREAGIRTPAQWTEHYAGNYGMKVIVLLAAMLSLFCGIAVASGS